MRLLLILADLVLPRTRLLKGIVHAVLLDHNVNNCEEDNDILQLHIRTHFEHVHEYHHFDNVNVFVDR